MKKNLFFTIIIILCSIILVFSNTSRDLKKIPVYDFTRIYKLLILYINVERINNGNPSFVINNNLHSSAKWHSNYMSKNESLGHFTSTKGMHDVYQRLDHFGERSDTAAEILSFSYAVSVNDIAFTKKTDADGDYIDFGKTTVRWLNETEIAMSLMKYIFKNSANKEFFSKKIFNSIGCGLAIGNHKGLQALYGSIVMIEKKGLFTRKFKLTLRKEIIKRKENKKEINETILIYTILGIEDDKVSLLVFDSSGYYKEFATEIENGVATFRIDDAFRNKLTADDALYFALYDKTTDMHYPIARLHEIK